MQLNVGSIQKLFRYQIFYTVLGVYIAAIIFAGIVGYVGYLAYQLYTEIDTLSNTLNNNKASVEFIGNNRDILADNLDSYNDVLGKLIPDEESYFSVVAALEGIAKKTGVSINSYTIDLEATNVSKLSLRVEVIGTQEAMQKLFDVYKYGGGRLITIEKIDASTTGDVTNVFLFNFYHQAFTVGNAGNPDKLTQKDIDLMNEIKNQM